MVSIRIEIWVTDIFPDPELGFEDMLGDRSKPKPVGEVTPGPDKDGEYAPVLEPVLEPEL